MIIAIMGESGSGKTTSMRNLDPATTYYIDCDKKGLSWLGWQKQYNKENNNYIKEDRAGAVMSLLANVNEKAPHIKTVVIDTLNGIMVADEMKRMKEKGYDKWADLAGSVWNLVNYALTVREDLDVLFLCHSQTVNDDNGYTFTRIKTSGKKIDKIVLESKFPCVLLAKSNDNVHVFEIHARNSSTKIPLGAFEGKNEIPNDIVAVLKELKGETDNE